MSLNQPLRGLRVIDLTQLLPGPMCTLHLADLGAEVIKIEPPGIGDPVRGETGFTPMFLMLNRNKRSLTLNLREAADLALMHRLVATADVLVEGFRPGVAERLGIGYAQLNEINPRLVYCSITGYGQHGPLAQAAGHDINYQGYAGVLEQNGRADGAPAPGNFQAADLAGGALSAGLGILAALFDVSRSGHGRHVDIAMTDCLMALNLMPTTSWQQHGAPVARGTDYISGGLACYGTYATRDGRYLAVGALEMKFWRNFCDALQRPDLYDKGHLPGDHGAATRAEVAEQLASHDLAHWIEVFRDVDACTTPVLRVDEVFEHANSLARGMVAQATHPQAGSYRHYHCPLRMSDEPWPEPTPAPLLGADNEAIRRELGIT